MMSVADPGPPYAHSANAAGRRQGLREHLEAVAELAAHFAEPFGGENLARAAALWHDLGKFNPEWQRYLLEAEAGKRASGTGPDHKGTGTCLASQRCDPLAFLIAGHHGGLLDLSELKSRLQQWRREGAAETLKLAPESLTSPNTAVRLPSLVKSQFELDLLLRMLFSTLVDADFLDTEQHLQVERAGLRGHNAPLSDLWHRFERHHDMLETGEGPVQRVRESVYNACLRAAPLPPGIFRLTVPTGGGKTLSAMAFALRHALTHGMQRVIVAVPYTSITEQTASVYRAAFGGGHDVLEHHSALDVRHIDDQTPEGLWGRLAAENWDARIIVTTTVQLFESVFAAKTSRCRKLHRIANSVVILDEAQALPANLLEPILDILQTLSARYRTTVVLCTATQPALDDAPGFAGLSDVREIAPNPPHLFEILRRVEYELLAAADRWSWERVAAEMHASHQALAIVNTVADAQTLFEALDDSEALHLSTLLCGEHRRNVLREIRQRLAGDRPCLVASTQVVEAGVDLDFPLVLRAMGPLDRIVQAAGRCNREGRLAMGRVVIFRPADGHLPPGSYRTAADRTAILLDDPRSDLHDPDLYQHYFRALFNDLDLDELGIQELRRHFRFAEVGKTFRMIQDDRTAVIVQYDEDAERLVRCLRSGQLPHRSLFRQIQPYAVAIRTRQFADYQAKGLVEEAQPSGLCIWLGEYDARRGLVAENRAMFA